MKILYSIFILFLLHGASIGQQPFFFTFEQPEIDLMADVVQIADRFYFIQNRTFNLDPPSDYDSYSDILITTDKGELMEIIPMDTSQAFYHRILKAHGNEIYLVGHIKSEICKSKLVISKFNIQTRQIDHLSYSDFCQNEIQKIKLIQGLANQTYIEEYHSKDHGLAKHIYRIDTSYQITLVMDSVPLWSTLSIDFSRNGYLISADKLKRFYDANFNFRKQKWFYEAVSCLNETHLPFGDHLILLGTIQPYGSDPDVGFRFMLIDSLLKVKKKININPQVDFPGIKALPFYGGVAIKNENEIWVAGENVPNPGGDPGYYFIIKLDSNLNITCQQFLGYDTWYRTYGLRVLESGGAIIVGTRLTEGQVLNEGLDVFAMRVGDNCEIPTTSIEDGTGKVLLSISAYPNPGINDLTFSVNGFDPFLLRVEIIDELGQVLFSKSDLTDCIQVPDFPSGQYFYRIFEKNTMLGVGAWVKQ